MFPLMQKKIVDFFRIQKGSDFAVEKCGSPKGNYFLIHFLNNFDCGYMIVFLFYHASKIGFFCWNTYP